MDKGKWQAFDTTDSRVGVISDDFTHDVVLYIDGDFRNIDQKKQYREWLISHLNGGYNVPMQN